jgi:hypothetical protein
VFCFQFARNTRLEEDEAIALAEVSRNIFCKFGQKKTFWDAAVQAISQLDALLRYEKLKPFKAVGSLTFSANSVKRKHFGTRQLKQSLSSMLC